MTGAHASLITSVSHLTYAYGRNAVGSYAPTSTPQTAKCRSLRVHTKCTFCATTHPLANLNALYSPQYMGRITAVQGPNYCSTRQELQQYNGPITVVLQGRVLQYFTKKYCSTWAEAPAMSDIFQRQQRSHGGASTTHTAADRKRKPDATHTFFYLSSTK